MSRVRAHRVAIACAALATLTAALSAAPAAAATADAAPPRAGTVQDVPAEAAEHPGGIGALATSLIGVAVFVGVTGVALGSMERRRKAR